MSSLLKKCALVGSLGAVLVAIGNGLDHHWVTLIAAALLAAVLLLAGTGTFNSLIDRS